MCIGDRSLYGAPGFTQSRWLIIQRTSGGGARAQSPDLMQRARAAPTDKTGVECVRERKIAFHETVNIRGALCGSARVYLGAPQLVSFALYARWL